MTALRPHTPLSVVGPVLVPPGLLLFVDRVGLLPISVLAIILLVIVRVLVALLAFHVFFVIIINTNPNTG